jgi:hypothetical protein
MLYFCLSLQREVCSNFNIIYINKKHTYIFRDTIHRVTTGLKQKIINHHIWDQLLNPRFLKQNITHKPKRLHTLSTNSNSDYRICHATNRCCNIPSCNMSQKYGKHNYHTVYQLKMPLKIQTISDNGFIRVLTVRYSKMLLSYQNISFIYSNIFYIQ